MQKTRSINQPVGFGEKEMEGYFMISNQDAAVAIVNKLSGTQIRLWLYLMMVDSFADTTPDGEKVYHEIPSPAEIALKIGANAQTVEKDMRVLRKHGLYDYRVTTWGGHNHSAANARKESDRLRQQKKANQTQSQQGKGLNNPPERLNNPQQGLNNPPERLNNPQQGLNNPQKTPEPIPENHPSSPQTIQTYTDFIQTLSEGEREQFEKFVRIEWKKLTTKNGELGEEIVSLERFLSRAEDIKNWYQRFLNSPAGEEVKKSEVASIDWTQHPEWSDWLAIMREGVPRFVALGTCFDNKTRRAIADWADERGLIWGTES